MDLFIISVLLVLGVLLILAEVFFVPGTTIVGIIGFICCIVGIVVTYRTYGNTAGTWVLVGTSAFSVFAIIYAFKSNTWDRFSLKSTSQSKVNDDVINYPQEGDLGKTVSNCRPYGSAIFNDEIFEVVSQDRFLEKGTEVKVVKLKDKQIFVVPNQEP